MILSKNIIIIPTYKASVQWENNPPVAPRSYNRHWDVVGRVLGTTTSVGTRVSNSRGPND